MLKERLKASLNRKLFEAIKNGQVDKMRRLIKRGAELNSQNELGQSPLSWAIDKNQIEIVRVLLTEYNLNSKMINNALFDAVYLGDIDIAKLLIENGADINTQKEFSDTPLHKAVREKNFDLVKLLIEYGADVNMQNHLGDTPLHRAVESARVDLVKLLIENGADVNIKDNAGWTPLHMAALNGYYDVAKLLIENGANVNIKGNTGWTPLHWAAYWNHINITKLLIEYGADVNIKNESGCTPLHEAAFKERYDIVKLLIENGADPDIRNNEGKTFLDLCGPEKRKNIEDFLKDYSTSKETKSYEVVSIFDNALLDFAYYNNLIEVKKCVYSGKFDINVQDDKGYTPLMYAIINNNLNMVMFLIEHGADINLCKNDGDCPLKVAEEYGVSNEIISYLKEKLATLGVLENKSNEDIIK